MLVDLTDVFISEGKTVAGGDFCGFTELKYKGMSYPVKENGKVFWKAANVAPGKALAEVSVKLTALLACDRCLGEVEYPFDLRIVRELSSPEGAKEEELEEQGTFMEGYTLHIERLIENEIMTSWPMKVLCRSDCKGLCPVCGKDLNTGACGCDTFVPDPRMAAIMDVFNANKEV